MSLAADPLTAIGNVADDVLKAVLPDKQAEVQARLQALQMRVQIIIAEAQSQSWLARNWRPMLMTIFMAIIANNYILAPYFQAMFSWHVSLDLPPQMWDLLKIGLGGYIVGRSVEKVASNYLAAKSNTSAPNAFTSGA